MPYNPSQNRTPMRKDPGRPPAGMARPAVNPMPFQEIIHEIERTSRFNQFPAESLVNHADTIGKHLRQIGLKTNQVRKFLDAVNRIRTDIKTDGFTTEPVVLLKPKLAYAAGREERVKPLLDVLVPCIDRTKDYKDFLKLARFIEAILAYHRYYGGE